MPQEDRCAKQPSPSFLNKKSYSLSVLSVQVGILGFLLAFALIFFSYASYSSNKKYENLVKYNNTYSELICYTLILTEDMTRCIFAAQNLTTLYSERWSQDKSRKIPNIEAIRKQSDSLQIIITSKITELNYKKKEFSKKLTLDNTQYHNKIEEIFEYATDTYKGLLYLVNYHRIYSRYFETTTHKRDYQAMINIAENTLKITSSKQEDDNNYGLKESYMYKIKRLKATAYLGLNMNSDAKEVLIELHKKGKLYPLDYINLAECLLKGTDTDKSTLNQAIKYCNIYLNNSSTNQSEKLSEMQQYAIFLKICSLILLSDEVNKNTSAKVYNNFKKIAKCKSLSKCFDEKLIDINWFDSYKEEIIEKVGNYCNQGKNCQLKSFLEFIRK